MHAVRNEPFDNEVFQPVKEGFILVVEDDAESSSYFADTLREHGFFVEVADSGAAALKIMGQRTPDLVLSDLRMPGIDGLALLAKTRALPNLVDVPFLLLSGASDVSLKVACLDGGACDFLTKPIDGVELHARVRQQLRQADRLEKLRTQIYVDELTGANNRRGTMRALEREQWKAEQGQGTFSLLMIDVDEFKSINDDFGHQVGDQVLRQIADDLAAAVRSGDVVGRMGGDEFVVVLPGIRESRANEVAERIRARVAESTRSILSRSVGLSVGVVTYGEGTVSTQALLESADRFMYRDKHNRSRPRLRALI